MNYHAINRSFVRTLLGTLLGTLLTTLLSTGLLANHALAKPATGEAPDFTLASNQGPNLRLQEQRGDVIMLNFWASWCGPCRTEMPVLDVLHQRFQAAGFKVIGVNVDSEPAKAERLLAELNVAFPILFDPSGDVSASYQVNAMPSTVLIDRDGQMRYRHEGYKPGYDDLYRTQIRELISE